MRYTTLLLCLCCARLEAAEDTPAFTQRPPSSIGAITIVGTTPPPADRRDLPSGCPDVQPKGSREEAKELFTKAQQMYHLGEYEEAAQLFILSHQQHPHPQILFNVALCYRQAGRTSEAIAYLDWFLCYETNKERREEAQRWRDELSNTPLAPPPG